MKPQLIAALAASLYADWLIAGLMLAGTLIVVGVGLHRAIAPVVREMKGTKT